MSEGELPQSIELSFDRQTIHQVRITFDIPFEEYKYGYMEQPIAKNMVTDFTLSLLTHDGWEEMRRITDNYMRLVVLDIEPTVASAVKITVQKVLDSKKTIITDIRIY